MPRAGWVKPESPRRLSDVVSVGVVTKVFRPDVVDEVIASCGRTEQRHRSLPAQTMAYFAIGLALHADGSYEDVLGLMADGLAWADTDDGPLRLPSKSGISQARERLGSKPLQVLFDRDHAGVLVGGSTVGGYRRDDTRCCRQRGECG